MTERSCFWESEPTRRIRAAIDFAAEHREQIEARIRRNDDAVEASRRAATQRAALLA